MKAGGAQVILNWANGTPAATVFRATADTGLNLPMVTSISNLTYEQMTAYTAFLPPQLYFFASAPFAPEVGPNGPIKRAVDLFLTAFKSAGNFPDQGEVLPWDASFLIVAALRKYGPEATASSAIPTRSQRSWRGSARPGSAVSARACRSTTSTNFRTFGRRFSRDCSVSACARKNSGFGAFTGLP